MPCRPCSNMKAFASRRGYAITHVDRDGENKVLRAERGDEVRIWSASEILLAAGRSPVVDGLDLENAGVDYNAKDGIAVNTQLQTTAPNIWAVGDVTQHAIRSPTSPTTRPGSPSTMPSVAKRHLRPTTLQSPGRRLPIRNFPASV